VAEERKRALKVLARLPDDPFPTERFGLRAIAWDKPGGGAPIVATPDEFKDRLTRDLRALIQRRLESKEPGPVAPSPPPTK
jgi:hypothetical protein